MNQYNSLVDMSNKLHVALKTSQENVFISASFYWATYIHDEDMFLSVSGFSPKGSITKISLPLNLMILEQETAILSFNAMRIYEN